MIKKYLFLTVLFSSFLHAESSDPFKDIKLHTLKNGLKIILAPDSKSEFVQIKVNVGVGFYHETRDNYGVSHLLEHVLFRDSKLKDDMSYLQLIKEREGSANGTTTWDRTNYYAAIKKKHADWIVETFHKMIMSPSLDKKHVETEKKTVLLEIGEPDPFSRLLGFDLLKYSMPSYLEPKDFWESHFKVKNKKLYTSTEEQLSTLKLNQKQVIDHYKKYYDPSNMQIILSGNFNAKVMLKKLIKLWGAHPSNGMGNQRVKYKAKTPKKELEKFSVETSIPRITMGYFVNKLSIEEKEVLLSYTDYLSHRLMKQLRNIDGETYTAHDSSRFKQDFGYFAVSLQTSREKFYDNKKIIEKMLKDELLLGKLDSAAIEEAKKLRLTNYSLAARSPSGSEKMAEQMFQIYDQEGVWKTPYEILTPMTAEKYKSILKKYAVEKRKYQIINHPELFFRYDIQFLMGITCIFFFFFYKTLLKKKFHNDQVKWIRKVAFPPLKTLELFTLYLIAFACMHSFFLLAKIAKPFTFLASIFLNLQYATEYIAFVIGSFVIIGTAQAVVSYFPRKLYVMGNSLVIKSLSYYSRHIKLDDIQSVKAVSLFKVLTSPSLWPKLWRSFHYYNPKFWSPGLLIELKNGRAYFIGVTEAGQAKVELEGILQKEEVIVEKFKEAA